MDEKEQAVVAKLVFAFGVPGDIQEYLIEWHLDRYYLCPDKLPHTTINHLLTFRGRHFVTLSHESNLSDYPQTEVAMIRDSFLDYCFVFCGKVDVCHLSRTKKSVIIKTEEPRFLNGDPWIISRFEKCILTLNGDVRNQV